MIIDLRNGFFLATGTVTRNAELKRVGGRQTPMTTFSFAAGKRQDTTTIFVDCKCWRNLALYASLATKGDSVCVVGSMEEREYNGKTYKSLVCEWMNLAVAGGTAAPPLPDAVSGEQAAFSDLTDADGELPF